MKLAFVELNGFRGYRKPMRIDFADRFTIIDGRNGAGKSTIFDAIEFALTGLLDKYDDAKAAGETVADYLWWTGEGPAPTDRYVEVGFLDGDTVISIRRKQFEDPAVSALEALAEKLCDPRLAPAAPLSQLCATATRYCGMRWVRTMQTHGSRVEHSSCPSRSDVQSLLSRTWQQRTPMSLRPLAD